MNSITLNNISKRFLRQWLFKNISIELFSGDTLLISGHNGSGKSTLLKIISGFVTPTQGGISYSVNSTLKPADEWFNHIAYAAHYMDVIEDFTLIENISFYAQFKKMHSTISVDEVVTTAFLEGAENKQVRNFSSGMKQRLKLTLAFLSDVPFLFLDEPLSNLDSKGVDWYHSLIEKYVREKIVIICSNNPDTEAAFCTRQLNIEDYKI